MLATPQDLEDFAPLLVRGHHRPRARSARLRDHAQRPGVRPSRWRLLEQGISLELKVNAALLHAPEGAPPHAGRSYRLRPLRHRESGRGDPPRAAPAAPSRGRGVPARAMAEMLARQDAVAGDECHPRRGLVGWTAPCGWSARTSGRHNALDKLIGAMALSRSTRPDGFIAVTSRASYEMVYKTASAGVGLLAAVSAPTGLAVRTAELPAGAGGVRAGERAAVYTHPERVMPGDLAGEQIPRPIRSVRISFGFCASTSSLRRRREMHVDAAVQRREGPGRRRSARGPGCGSGAAGRCRAAWPRPS